MPKIKCVCKECGEDFEAERYRVKNGGGQYCSRQCSMRATGKKYKSSWREGRSKDDPKIVAANKAQSETLKKRHADGDLKTWNDGLTKDTDDRVADYVAKQTVMRNTPGPQKDAWRAALSAGQVKAHADGKYPFTFTKPEQIVWAFLESKKLTVKEYKDRLDSDEDDVWYHNFPVGKFVADFGCEGSKSVIECNGCYVHGHDTTKCKHRTAKYGRTGWGAGNIKKDRRKYSYYERNGWNWALVWECEGENGDFHRVEAYCLSKLG